MRPGHAILGVGAIACVGLLFFITTQEPGTSGPGGIISDGFDLEIDAPATPTSRASSRTAPQAASPAAESSESISLLRDAVAASPIPTGRFLPPPPSSKVLKRVRRKARASRSRLRKDSRFRGLLKDPYNYLAKRTNLRSPAALRAFLKDRRRTSRYFSHPLIRGILSSPTLVRLTLKTPGLVRGFLASPAMRDPRSMQAIIESGFLAQLMRFPGVRKVSEDQAFVTKILSDPKTMKWLAKNPGALDNLAGVTP